MADKLVLRVAPRDPLVLLAFLRKRAPDVAAVALIKGGGVHVNGAREKNPQRALEVGARIIVYSQARLRVASPALTVLYRDDDLAVVDKPHGMLAQAVAADSESALDAVVRRQLGAHAVPMHRLDRETSGVVLVALSPLARGSFAEDLAAHQLQRDYVAIVKHLDQVPDHITLRIARDPDDPRRRRALPEADNAGDAATTHLRVLGQSQAHTALLIRLETGRTHQIRVHLQAIGAPIVGDSLYGGEPAPRLLLHAARLRLRHPSTNEPLAIHAPLPSELALHLRAWDPNLIFGEDRSH